MDLAGPVAGGPEFAELGVEGFVELALDVGVVGGVAGSDFEIRVIRGLGDWFFDDDGGLEGEEEGEED